MITGELKAKVDSIWETMWSGEISNPLSVIEGLEASALYEPPFSNMYGGGPDELFCGRENVIEGLFEKLEEGNTVVAAKAS